MWFTGASNLEDKPITRIHLRLNRMGCLCVFGSKAIALPIGSLPPATLSNIMSRYKRYQHLAATLIR